MRRLYTNGKPFMVVSDAFPQGHIPKPTVPNWFFEDADPEQRKRLKKKVWMPLEKISLPLSQWQTVCKTPAELFPDAENTESSAWQMERIQPHNSINRLTGTTGTGEFAPYGRMQQWYKKNVLLDCHIVLDENRLAVNELRACLDDLGAFGFGRDATIGAGKFDVLEEKITSAENPKNIATWITLAPCAPQGLGYNPALSFYQPFTRFGKHGDIAVHQSGRPFKTPVLLAQTGAIFGIENQKPFIGQGIGGHQHKLSNTIDTTVQQGYAPVLPVPFPEDLIQKLEQAA
ncbi:MAG TPA: CRISPR-associated protein Csm7 [Gammaproteobacteria bacterium]|nr:CRISPR-associated protein Csm7 [Gammaproteobacteria bacterium]